MPQIYAALGLQLVYYGCAAVAMYFMPEIASSHDIGRTCVAMGLALDPCRAGAMTVAALSVATLVAACFVAAALNTTFRPASSGRDPLAAPAAQWLLLVLLFALTIVLVRHNIVRAAVAEPSTVRIPAAESAFISLENLSWPLLLQLVLWARVPALKALLVAFLAAVIALSPFRAVLFAVLYFGGIVPLVAWLWKGRSGERRPAGLAVAALALLVAIAGVAIVYQTEMRRVPTAAAEPTALQPGGVVDALASRALSPFFQGELAARVAADHPSDIPTFIDTIAAKFNRGTVVSLNQRLYVLLYGSETEGQMTSMLLGEAVANSGQWPAYWAFSAPLLLVLAYMALRPVLDLRALFAVALWRSGMGGLFDVLPALALQVAFCLAIGWCSRAGQRS